MTRQERREQLTQEWTNFLSRPSVQHSLNVRLELTLKQRRNSELVTARPQDEDITVRIAPRRKGRKRRIALRDAPLFAPYFYLTEDEAKRIAVRVMNRLNRELFGTAARRKKDPLRLTALICQHDKGTRRHLHVLLALPPDVTLTAFRTALTHATQNEPFVYRVTRLERIENLAASIIYNTNENKAQSQNAILYIYPQAEPPQPENGEQPQ